MASLFCRFSASLFLSRPIPTKLKANRWKEIMPKVEGESTCHPDEVGMPTRSKRMRMKPSMPPMSDAGKSRVCNILILARRMMPATISRLIQMNAAMYG